MPALLELRIRACHVRGSFTGADRRREGYFVQAEKGTLFLDEIGEVSAALQARLLRAIQEREVRRVGGDKPIAVDARIIAATNRDLEAMVHAGAFREDLYYRLNVVTLHAPPLRERVEDIPLLAQRFLEACAARNRKTLRGFTPQAMDRLLKHPWPGNVRELENCVERAVIMALGDYSGERDLPKSLIQDEDRAEAPADQTPTPAASGDRSLEDVEREAILATLARAGGNKSEAARVLGVSRVTLHAKLKKFGLGQEM